MTVTIRALANTSADRRKFIKFAWKIYQDDPNWVPPLMVDLHTLLDPEKHPYHEHATSQLFLAERDGEPVGRIAAHINHRYNEWWNDRTGFFGFFECINNQAIADALIDRAKTFLRHHRCSHIQGPFNWSTNEECGLLVDAFDMDPVILMNYNPPYYPRLLEKAGLTKAKDLYAYRIQEAAVIPERLERGVNVLKKRYPFSLRTLDMKNFWDEVELIKSVYNPAWSRNWGAVPMTDAEFEHLAKDLKMIVNPDLCYIAKMEDEVVGFSLTIPDANQAIKYANGRLFPFGLFKILWHMRQVNFVRVLALGVIDKYRNHGIDAALYYETFKRGIEMGFNSGEMSWILEDNYPMRNALEKMGAEIYKTYRIYEQSL
ncbi:MAG: N-acetyltransferase [Candidatus Marinimicrobia bacterium]|nr:N-acetyltransferase [Candidatus Neomarinimicrobiota bacterium]MCF7827901.1 N-acetyltransferase [Candidatus Neomarinimicrobiota bacterium]MCF7879344.1 N-acetyltransferase [Candidatus Neomarinimicrobiota bacterium]